MKEFVKQKATFETYIPEQTKPDDFDLFWDKALHSSAQVSLNVTRNKIAYPLANALVEKVVYHGEDTTPIHADWIRPKTSDRVPCLIHFHGYGGDKGSVTQYAHWVLEGYGVLSVDVRGHGESGDAAFYPHGTGGSWVTQGILSPENYYYRHVFLDGVRAIDVVRQFEEVDEKRIGLIGGSMGGGIVLGVAALDQRPSVVVSDVPNLCDVPLAIHQKMEGSLQIVERFMARNPEHVEQVFQTLAYVDHVNLSERITAPIRMSAAMRDFVCPPQPIFGVYNRVTSEKELKVFPYSGHDAPGSVTHIAETIAFIKEWL
ncbi:acetylxylan esterase [Bacillaceae bacterium SIJ1]|uniref:acetylxylan esterase n=1 Tax=Litoribacterium kuwaitense TaxID=1398745 RepID=UPI0013EB1E98|nr:alpha/beta fold hydrolase [Litoribacterium kuwaitense]NGP45058.1 acetylxylan esterase [Litoribacterium kuwaitense]